MDTKFLSFEEDTATSTIISTVEDNVTGQQYKIRSKYLFGADGARSVIVKQLGLELQGRQSDNLAIDVLVKADLSHLVEHRKGNLHWLIQPDVEHPVWGWLGVAQDGQTLARVDLLAVPEHRIRSEDSCEAV